MSGSKQPRLKGRKPSQHDSEAIIPAQPNYNEVGWALWASKLPLHITICSSGRSKVLGIHLDHSMRGKVCSGPYFEMDQRSKCFLQDAARMGRVVRPLASCCMPEILRAVRI